VTDDRSDPEWVDNTGDADLLCNEEEDSDFEDYQAIIDSLEDSYMSTSQKNKLNGYHYTTIALSVDEQM
jgi:hypothetical protein